MDRKFVFFESYHRALSRVPDSSYGRVVRSMAEFVFEGMEPTFENDIDVIAWELIKPILEHGQEISKVRAEAGSKGKGISRNVGNNNASKDKTKQNNTKTIQNNTDKERKGIGIGKEYIKENNKRNSISVVPDYVDPDFAPIMQEWMDYKRERGQTYKPRGLKSCYRKLVELSGNAPDKAKAIIENSISNNYSGFFEIKNNTYGTTNYRPEHRPTSADNIAAAQQEHIRSIAESIAETTNRTGEVLRGLPDD